MPTKALITGLVAATVITLSGCGGNADNGTDATGQAGHGSGQAAVLTKANFASSLTQSISNASSVHVSGSVRASGQSVTATVDVSFGDHTLEGVAANLRATIPGMGQLQGRLVRGTAYVNAQHLGLGDDLTKPWLKLDLTSPDSPLAPMLSRLSSSLESGELERTLDGITTLTRVGVEKVDGVATTHYRATIDTSRLSDTPMDPALGHGMTLPKTIQYDVWVDGQHRPVRFTSDSARYAVDLHFSQWGVPVHVVAPPPGQVQDASRALGGLLGGHR